MTSIQTQVEFIVWKTPGVTTKELYKSIGAVSVKDKQAVRTAKHRALSNQEVTAFKPKKKIKKLSKANLTFKEFVGEAYPPYKKLYAWQYDLFGVLEKESCIEIVVPRDHGKSILLTFYIEWLMDKKHMDVLLLGWTDRVRQMAMYVYSYFMRNNKLSADSVMRNTMNHFMTSSDIRFDCYGLKEKAILGFHPEDFEGKNGLVLIVDDPMDESFEFYPAKERDLEARWESTISNINPTKLIVCGTRKFEGDFLEYIANQYKSKIKLYHKTPYNADGSLLCPERWTLDRLEEKRFEIGEYRFSGEYMGDPTPITGGVWLEGDIHYTNEPKVWSKYESAIISVDPAWTQTNDSDFTAISVVLREANTKRYLVTKCIATQMDFDKILQTIENEFCDIRSLYNHIPITVAIESNGGGRLLIDIAASRDYVFNKNVLEVKHSRAKQERIMVLEMPIKTGAVKFLDYMRNGELILEVLTYPNCRKDDAIDSLAMAYTEMEQKYARQFVFRRSGWK